MQKHASKGFADVLDGANMNSLFEMEDGKKRRRTALVLWPKGGLLSVCLLLLSCPGVHLLSPTGLEDS